jgi:hypothetical protein
MLDKELVLEIKWIGPFQKSKKGDRYYRIVTFNVVAGECDKQPKVYLDNGCRNYKNWESLLVERNIITGLIWKDKSSGTIHGDSPVHLV